MAELFVPSKLKEKVGKWRSENYPCKYQGIGEILNYNLYEDEKGNKILRYLRKAQFEALETYWYLRLVENTPHIFDLYKKLYGDPVELLKSLGISLSQEDLIKLLSSGDLDMIFEKIKSDNEFVKENKLEVVRESLTLSYPSYILALAMGSGKTILIGSIIATEFAMALEYQNDFVKNALVFAPGKTILGALKEISDIPFDKILPPRYYKQFISSVKITYTQDREKDILIVKKSSFNIIVTNTEKIRIQKNIKNLGKQRTLYNFKEKEEEEVANLRLQTIASLPHLAIFSDEAHHTYGQSLGKELKKVRMTVDYLADNTNVMVVVNTTGTPYYKKQMLRDVIFWYGLSQGIKDGILKEVKDSIYSYEDIGIKDFVDKILEDFFKNYKNVKTFNGSNSKIAIYFPRTDDVKKIKPFVEQKMIEFGLDSSVVFDVNNKSEEKKKDYFNNRVNEVSNPYRVYLLVNMGTEGWNCPSLYATALARKLKTSNNFVLQAASRCLRQIPNNEHKARIYLSKDNINVLDSQLKETYGETLKILEMTKQDMKRKKLILRKVDIPKILIKRKIKRVVLDENSIKDIKIKKPDIKVKVSKKVIYDIKDREERKKILSEKEIEEITLSEDFEDIYQVAIDISTIYRLDINRTYDLLKDIYTEGEIPLSHIDELKKQIDKQSQKYKITEEEIEQSLALIKKEGFDEEEIKGKKVYTAEIIYHKAKEHLLVKYEELKDNKKGFGFHYSPYKMDSNPEKEFFLELLEKLNEKPDDVEDIYYTGQLTSRDKTEFLFEYKDKKGKWRNYAPDFVIRKKDGKVLIVEIKAEVFYDEHKDMAIRELEKINPDMLKYEILFTDKDDLKFGEFDNKVKSWVYSNGQK